MMAKTTRRKTKAQIEAAIQAHYDERVRDIMADLVAAGQSEEDARATAEIMAAELGDQVALDDKGVPVDVESGQLTE